MTRGSIATAPRRAVYAALLSLVLLLGVFARPAAAACTASPPAEGYRMLFDGTAESLAGWTYSGPGSFTLQADCSIKSSGGLGLLWHTEQFDSYTLKLDWKLDKIIDNSGVFVGFPAAGAQTHSSAIAKGYEVQIDQIGRSDGQPRHYTGAIYDIQGPNRDTRFEGTDSRGWNSYEITVDAPKIIIRLNGVVVNEFTSVDIARDISTGHIGLQAHGGPDTAYFRNVQIKEIEPGSVSGGDGGGGGAAPQTGTLASLRNNTGITQDPTSNANFDGGGWSYSSAAALAAGVSGGGAVKADGLTYTWPKTASGAADNVTAQGQTVVLDGTAGKQRLGLLTSTNHGPSTGTFLLNYEYTDASGATRTKSVEHGLTISDWTLNGGSAQPSTNNVKAFTTKFRMLSSAAPVPTDTHAFSVSVPLEAGMTLKSVTLPAGTSGGIHIWDIALG